jgi:glucose-1-phosphate cytidylyltransferase
MKVVLFCGGFGMRLREYSDSVPKPMVPIGHRPMLWHVMKYYAHFGHTEFILCLGYKGDVIRDYFTNYEARALGSPGGAYGWTGDVPDWDIQFVETGLNANIGQRLKAVEQYISTDEMFLANYSDGLSDVPLPALIDFARATGATATFLCVKPTQTFHFVSTLETGLVSSITDVRQADMVINGGFFVFKRDIFDYIESGDELVQEPFQRLIERQKLAGFVYRGFWACMDTYKEKQHLEDIIARGEVPWEVWRGRPAPLLA